MAYFNYDKSIFYLDSRKIRIYPDENQKAFINGCFDLSRFIFNWCLELEQKVLYNKSGYKFLSKAELTKLFTSLRSQNEWMRKYPYSIGLNTIDKLEKSFLNYFKKLSKKPKFKSKKNQTYVSVKIRSNRSYFKDSYIKIDGLKTLIYTGYISNFDKNTKLYNTYISRDNLGRYWFSYSILKRKLYQPISFYPIGIDLNIKNRFVCSNGYMSGSPNIDRLLKREKRFNKKCQKDRDRYLKLARTKSIKYQDIEQSKRAKKRLNKYRRINTKIHNIIENFIQTETRKILDFNPSSIIMEDLDINGMKKNKYISYNIQYSSFYRCRTVMKYKADKLNIPFILADRKFPSSQLCSNCGNKLKIGMKKIYKCPICGLKIDRDLNAAINLSKLAF